MRWCLARRRVAGNAGHHAWVNFYNNHGGMLVASSASTSLTDDLLVLLGEFNATHVIHDDAGTHLLFPKQLPIQAVVEILTEVARDTTAYRIVTLRAEDGRPRAVDISLWKTDRDFLSGEIGKRGTNDCVRTLTLKRKDAAEKSYLSVDRTSLKMNGQKRIHLVSFPDELVEITESIDVVGQQDIYALVGSLIVGYIFILPRKLNDKVIRHRAPAQPVPRSALRVSSRSRDSCASLGLQHRLTKFPVPAPPRELETCTSVSYHSDGPIPPESPVDVSLGVGNLAKSEHGTGLNPTRQEMTFLCERIDLSFRFRWITQTACHLPPPPLSAKTAGAHGIARQAQTNSR